MRLDRTIAAALALSVTGADAQRTQCVVKSQYKCSGGKSSDSPAIEEAFKKCAKDAEIVFSEGVEYNVFSPLKVSGLSNVIVHHLGNLNLPQNVTYMQEVTAKNGGSLKWFDIRGDSITTGWFRGYGQNWYDANPPGGTGLPNRPHLMYFGVNNGYGEYWKSSKPPGANFQLAGKNITIRKPIIDAVSSSSSFPFNTDGFGCGAEDLTIEDAVIYNGDDAFAVGSGARNVVVRRATIGYQTHGMSIGSLGKDPSKPASVSNILFDDVTVAGGLYAARFKSWSGGQGLAKDVTWQNIRVYNVSFPIFVTQVYYDQAKTPGGPGGNGTTQAVNMENFSWVNFTGSVNSFNSGDGSCASKPCWYDIGLPSNLNHTEAAIIQCATETSCKNFKVENVRLFPDSGEAPTQICQGVSAETSPHFGLVCANVPHAIPLVPIS
ncbi:uncharacterized protein E0L32_001645 [Thyridium curvatum]|nr:uncharacterized protein E0L32_001645 [Thyridium curvatum]TPX09185.1 hypothetical protein E0L32_001645 [Thyridium curvatum]